MYMEAKIVRHIDAEGRVVIARGGGWGNGEILIKRQKVSIFQNSFWRSAVQNRAYYEQICMVYLTVC